MSVNINVPGVVTVGAAGAARRVHAAAARRATSGCRATGTGTTDAYDWRQGYWEPARPDYAYAPGRWVRADGGWRWVEPTGSQARARTSTRTTTITTTGMMAMATATITAHRQAKNGAAGPGQERAAAAASAARRGGLTQGRATFQTLLTPSPVLSPALVSLTQ